MNSTSGEPAFATEPADATFAFFVHGLPGEALSPDNPVDVLVDDTLCALSGFTFGTNFRPIPVEPRSYNFKISPANEETPCGIANGDQVGVSPWPGAWEASTFAAGETDPAAELFLVMSGPFTIRLVCVVGSATDGTLTFIDETIDLRGARFADGHGGVARAAQRVRRHAFVVTFLGSPRSRPWQL